MSIVVSRPLVQNEKKPSTAITYDWSEDVVQSMVYGGLEVYDIQGVVKRDVIEWALLQPDVDTFVHYGHGINEALLGSNGEAILDDYNLDLLKDKVVISINCESADHFGAIAVDAGARTYLGYDHKVYIRYNEKKLAYAGFKESNNAWNTLRLNGEWCTMWDAFNYMVDTYRYWIDVYRKNGYPELQKCLQKSLESLIILGDETQYLPIQNPVQILDYEMVYPENKKLF